MNDQFFSLQPFAKDSTLSNLEVIGTISRQDPYLVIQYTVLGEIDRLIIPPLAEVPTRSAHLWEHTCLEFFLGIKNTPSYWEFNLSPAGHWNIYHFEDYRHGMQEEQAYQSLPFTVETESDALSLSLKLDLDDLIPLNHRIDLGISAVTQAKNEHITYWALAHCGTQPDFHQRGSFTISL